jgi:hypothetical protein
VAYWTPGAAFVWNNLTTASAIDTVLLYFPADNHQIGAWGFGSQTVTTSTFTINMPTNAYNTALVQLN